MMARAARAGKGCDMIFRVGVMAGICVLSAAGAFGQAPTVLSGFETPADLALWTGLERTQAHGEPGGAGADMAFTIPPRSEDKGEDIRPGVRLKLEGGKDLSKYYAIAVDVWVQGDKPGQMGLKVIDGDDASSWTTHITVEPGKKNEALLTVEDIEADCESDDIREVVLYALRPDHEYTLVVDNLRLLPKSSETPAKFIVRYPNYRGMIFPDGPDVTVELIDPGRRPDARQGPRLRLEMRGGDRVATIEDRPRRAPYRILIPHASIPAGNVTLCAKQLDGHGHVLTEASWELRKMTVAEMAGMASYVDAANNLVVDGKPFFPMGWYSNRSVEYLDEVADSPFNTLLVYGTNRVPRAEMTAFLDRVQARGLKLVYCMNDVYPGSEHKVTWEGISGNDQVAPAVIDAYKGHPAVIAWYLNDELPRTMAPQLEAYYNLFKTRDANHPCFIVLCQRKDFSYLQHTTDILGGDPYPIPAEPVTRVSHFADKMNEGVYGIKPCWLVPQAFGWYQYKSKDKNRAHIPTAEELTTGRAPTRDESRCMTYLSLVHGAKGLIYYCYYDMHLLPQYPEMWGWMKDIGAEVKELSPVLLSPEDLGSVKVTPRDAGIHTKLKVCDGRRYLMAVNPGNAPCRVKFHVPARKITVLFEERAIFATGRSFSDDFEPLGVHVYDLGPVAVSGTRR